MGLSLGLNEIIWVKRPKLRYWHLGSRCSVDGNNYWRLLSLPLIPTTLSAKLLQDQDQFRNPLCHDGRLPLPQTDLPGTFIHYTGSTGLAAERGSLPPYLEIRGTTANPNFPESSERQHSFLARKHPQIDFCCLHLHQSLKV